LEEQDKQSLLNTVRAVMKIRNEEQALQEGSLDLLENLPKGVFGYTRTSNGQKIIVLLNFNPKAEQFSMEYSSCIFKLAEQDEARDKIVQLSGFGGMILKAD